MPQAEVSQPSSVQSERITEVMFSPGNSTSLPLGQQLYKWLIQHFDEETTEKLVSNLLDDQKLGIWFYDVVDIIGINEEHRKACQQAWIMHEILLTFLLKNTYYVIGSSIEGTFAAGEKHDYDVMQYHESYPVFEKKEGDTIGCDTIILIIRELTTPPGYVKLQLVLDDMQGKLSLNSDMKTFIHKSCKIDKCERIFLHEIFNLPDESPFMYSTENKPALKNKNYYGVSFDNNIACRLKTWPTFAKEWISRNRFFGWPTNSMVQQLSLLGFFVVKKGHPLSPEKDIEWRASFSLQERQLMFSLTDVQHKCYTVLKMFNREILKSDCITSYHWKTCLFYVIEQNSSIIWKKEKLFVCINICILLMLTWVNSEYCPNYFIPEDNLFVGTLNESQKLKLESKLKELLRDGLNCLVKIKAGNICEYYLTRDSLEDFKLLQSNSEHDCKKALYKSWRDSIITSLEIFNHKILDRYIYHAHNDVLIFIQDLWSMLKRIIDTPHITEHTTKETKKSLSSLLPHIYTCLASSIAAIAIQNTNIKVRDFLLLGSFTYFMKGNLPGKLKFISVLYSFGLYEECEWYIDQLDEGHIKYASSFCGCRILNDNVLETSMNITPQEYVSTCVSFLSAELQITPDALKYEMFRYFGISVTKEERAHIFCQWHYKAVVDCNFYFLFLKFLIKHKRRRIEKCSYIYDELHLLLSRQQVRHRDVALNLMAWIHMSILDECTPAALYFLTLSWNYMNSLDLCLFIITEEMKRKQYQFNAAKLHALVVLHKTWFVINTSSNIFCFHCYSVMSVKEKNFKKCSNCKISTYCSKQCQKNDWKIHKVVCKIVKTYHNI